MAQRHWETPGEEIQMCLFLKRPWTKFKTIIHHRDSGWWFQPIWKILVKLGIFPKYCRDENKKSLKPPPRIYPRHPSIPTLKGSINAEPQQAFFMSRVVIYPSISFHMFFHNFFPFIPNWSFNTIHPQQLKPDHRKSTPGRHLSDHLDFAGPFLNFLLDVGLTICDAKVHIYIYMYIHINNWKYQFLTLLLLLMMILGQKSKRLKWMESTRETSIYIPFANDILCVYIFIYIYIWCISTSGGSPNRIMY